jgi:hypothetical protein
MTDNMRGFSREMETRLDRVYKNGAQKKYGYDSITNLSQTALDLEERKLHSFEDRKLEKL